MSEYLAIYQAHTASYSRRLTF